MLSNRTRTFALAALVLVAACGAEQADQPGDAPEESAAAEESVAGQGAMEDPHAGMEMPGQSGVTRIRYGCADGKTIQLALHEGTGKADLVMGDETVTLASDRSASGMRFTDGTWTFHGKGPEAFVQKGEEMVYTDCRASGHP